jgi:predicted transcriptional regulator
MLTARQAMKAQGYPVDDSLARISRLAERLAKTASSPAEQAAVAKIMGGIYDLESARRAPIYAGLKSWFDPNLMK